MTGAGRPLIDAAGVTKVYHRGRHDEVVAVAEVSMSVGAGEVVAVVGPSGSGKTSLLSLVGCMARPTAGRIRFRDVDVAKMSERDLTVLRRGSFGFVFQRFHLIPGLSVLDNVMVPMVPTAAGFVEMRRRAEWLLESLDLGGARRRSVSRLSGGEQQRVAIARALANDPQVLVADEPTAHLDREMSEELMGILAELNRSGRTIVVATHDPLVFEHPLVRRRLPMRDGRLEEGVTV